MRRRLLALAIVAMLLLLLVWVLGRPTTGADLPVAPPPPVPARTQTTSPAPAPAPQRSAAAACSFEVTVQGADGPANVVLVHHEKYETLATWRTSTEEGRARFEDLAPGTYRATADRDGSVPASMRSLRCTGTEALAVTLVLQPADVWFTGEVTDTEGRRLDAEVSIVEAGRTGVFPGPASVATQDGTYRIGAVAGTKYNLYANAEGYHFGSSMTQSPEAGDELVVDFQLRLEGLVHGTLVGPDGSPVAGAVVRRHPNTGKTATSGPDGRYALGTVPGQRHVIGAHAGDLYGWVEAGVVEEGEDRFEVDIDMIEGRTVTGRVVHADTGEPVGPTTVAWFASGGGLNARVPVDADGTFVATGVPHDWPPMPGVIDPVVPSDHVSFFVYDHSLRPEILKVGLPPDATTIEVPFRARPEEE